MSAEANNLKSLNPRDFLLEKFLEKKTRNTTYSLRAFARDLGVSASLMSRILNNQRPVSYRLMSKMLASLNIASDISENLIKKIILNASHEAKISQTLRKQAKLNQNLTKVSFIPVERFKVISQWYHVAILELTYCDQFKNDALWISKKLGISKVEAQSALDQLIELNMLKRDGSKLVKSESTTIFSATSSTSEIRRFESTMLDKAKLELENTNQASFDNRLINSLTIPVSSECVPEIKKEILRFQKRIFKIIKNKKHKEVYQLGCQFFPISKQVCEVES